MTSKHHFVAKTFIQVAALSLPGHCLVAATKQRVLKNAPLLQCLRVCFSLSKTMPYLVTV